MVIAFQKTASIIFVKNELKSQIVMVHVLMMPNVLEETAWVVNVALQGVWKLDVDGENPIMVCFSSSNSRFGLTLSFHAFLSDGVH